jgi:plastocyanin
MSAHPRTTHPRTRFPLAGAIALGLVLAACSPAASSPAASDPAESPAESAAGGGGEADHVITISGTSFDPSSLTIAAGESVAFENSGSNHRIVEGEEGTEASDPAFEALSLGAGDISDPIAFDEPGSYPVTCTIHPSMQMTIVVE